MSENNLYKIMIRKLGVLIIEIRNKGFLNVIRIRTDMAFIALLARIYKFPASWHPPTSARPYRLAVAELVNSMEPKIVCEVGCGLGEILCRVNAKERYGYDIDEGVVHAAKLLRGKGIHFEQGGLAAVSMGQIDVLILVNWIHEVSPAELAGQLLPLLPRTRYLVLDAIDQDNTFGYRYKHDFAFLESKARRLSVVRAANEGRSFQLFEVIA